MPGAGIVLTGVGLPAAAWPCIPVVIISETLTLLFCVFVPVMPSVFSLTIEVAVQTGTLLRVKWMLLITVCGQ